MTHAPSVLAAARGYVFDIDGTLALGDKDFQGYQALPGAVEIVKLLRDRGVPCIAFTNGSVKTPVALVRALNAAGFPFDEASTMTPVSVAIDHFTSSGVRRVLALGGEGVWRPLLDAGIEVVVAPERCDDAQAVLVGWHPQVRLNDLDAAARAVWGGAALYTVSMAPYVASREGRTLGISGALSAALHNITGQQAQVLGKPSALAMHCASVRLGLPAREIAVVGDDVTLETVMAREGGAIAVGVHTGLAGATDFAALPEAVRPHLSLSGVDRLLELITALPALESR